MLARPQDLADRMTGAHKREIFILPVAAARIKAREILNQFPRDGCTSVVEHWQQLPDGWIEFTVHYLPTVE